MTKVKKLTIGLLSSVVFACALVCTANFAFAEENPLQKIQDTLNSLYAGNDIVAQDVYGVFADEYATSQTKVTFAGGEDTAVDIVKIDGTVVFQTSTATTYSAQDPVWQQYRFIDSTYSSPYVARDFGLVGNGLNAYNYAIIQDKTTLKLGAVDRDGQFIIPAIYDKVSGDYAYKTSPYCYGVITGDTNDTYTLYNKETHQVFKSLVATHSSYPSISFSGSKYFSIGYGSYYKIVNNDVQKLDNVSQIWYKDDGYYVIKYTNGDFYLESPQGTSIFLLSSSSYYYASFIGNFIIFGYSTDRRVFNFSGTEVTAKIPTDCSLSRSLQDSTNTYTIGTTSSSVYVFDKNADTKAQLTGKIVGSYDLDPYFCIYNMSDTTITVDLYNCTFTKIKTLKQIQVPSGKSLQNLSWFPRTTQVINGSMLWFYWDDQGSSSNDYYWFDNSFNEVSESDFATYQLKTGTKIYQMSVGEEYSTKYTDYQGNDICVGGYKLAVYYDGTISYYQQSLRHGLEDIWWAQNTNTGKYGAIDSYGNIIVAFQYDKFRDINDGSDDALGYKDGKWEVISFEPVPKPQPVVDSTTESTITLSWPAISSATKYAVATKNADGSYKTYTSNLQTTNYTITGLTQNTTYKCLVQAYVNGQWSSYTDADLVSATTQAHVEPGCPVVRTTVGPNDGEITLSWDAIENATNYAAYEVVNGKFVQIGNILSSETRTVTATDLACGVAHTFLVQAKVNGEWSSSSSSHFVSETPTGPVKPTLEEPVATGTSIKLSWNKVPGASKYAVATRPKGQTSWTTHTLTCTDLTYTVSNLEESVRYECLVQAYVNGKWSDFTSADLKEATTTGTRPVVDAQPSGDGQVTLTWAAIENADKYVAYEVVGNTFNQIEDFIPSTTTSKVVNDLANGYEHTFLVQARVGGTWSKFSKDNYAYATPTGTIKPALNEPQVSGTSIKLTWNKVPGASKYAVATRTETGGYVTHSYNETGTEFTVTGLEDSTKYYCLVQANINGKWSQFSDSDLKPATTQGTRPVVTATATGDGQVTLTWPEISGADKYVAYEVVNGNYNQIGDFMTAGTTSKVVNDLANGYEHTFLVQAQVDGVWSKFSSNNYAYATPSGTMKPTQGTPMVTGTTVTVSWNKVPGASAYAIATKVGNGNWFTHSYSCTDISFTMFNLESGVKYDCIVQANINGKWTAFTEADYSHFTTKGNSPIVTATPSADGQVTLTWEAIPSAQKYVTYEVVNGKYNQIGSEILAPATSLVVSDLVNEQVHTFLVQSYVDGKWSSFSSNNFASATPTGAVKPAIKSNTSTANSITVNWDKVSGSDGYCAAISTDGVHWTNYMLGKDATTYTFTGLKSATTYKVLVQRRVGSQWSSFTTTDIKSVTTL